MSGYSERKLCEVALRTLGHDGKDYIIPPYYLQILRNHFERYPEEDNFLMDLEDGTLTCLYCWRDVLAVDSSGELKGLDAFWEHITTPAHQSRTSKKLKSSRGKGTKRKPIDVDLNLSGDHTMTDHQTLRNPLPATGPRRRVRKVARFFDGAAFEYSTDEDVQQPAPALAIPDTSQGSSRSSFFSGDQFSSLHSASGSTSPFASSRSLVNPYFAPTDHHPSFSGPSTHSTLPVAGPSSYASAKPIILPPLERRWRHDFGDGDVIYISSDDETVGDSPKPSPAKRPRLGGALLKTDQGVIRSMHNANQRGPSEINREIRRTPSPVEHTFDFGAYVPNEPSAVQHIHDAFSTSFAPSLPSPFSQDASFQGESAENFTEEALEWALEDLRADWPQQPYDMHMPGGFPPIVPDSADEDEVRYTQTSDYTQFPGVSSVSSDCGASGPSFPDYGARKINEFFLSVMEGFQETPKVVDAAHSLGLPDPMATLPGLEIRLMPHQLIGVSWMVSQEEKNVCGGILADDMGLGKTVQCIATCVKNRPSEETVSGKSTLVLAPAALLDQWATEFRQRTVDGLFRVYIHHGTARLRSVKDVQQYDVVITTYHTLCSDFPKEEKDKGTADTYDNMETLGPLAATQWYRIVLDEAQCIRNRKTRSSRCVASLNAKYRWALTGTPVVNTLADIYSLVRFLRFRPFDDWKEFNDHIVRIEKSRPDTAGKRAQAVLKKCLLRRTKYTKLEGKLILQLPLKHIEVVEIELSPDEREIYEKVEKQQQQKMSKFLKTGTVMKNYAEVLVMLLRLRQVCNHPQLIIAEKFDSKGQSIVAGEGGAEDLDPAAELSRAERSFGHQYVEDVRTKLRQQAEARIQAEIKNADIEDNECPICFDAYVNNCRVTGCKHMFCSDCLDDLFKNKQSGVPSQDVAVPQGLQDVSRSCPVCRARIHPELVFKTSAFEPSESELDALKAVALGSGTTTNGVIDITFLDDDKESSSADTKGKGVKIKNEDADIVDMVENLSKDETFEPSTKMQKLLDYIKQWHLTAPEDKIICYSQWTSMIDLVQKWLAKDNIASSRFDGKMSRLSRDAALTEFRRRDGPPIMLVSLKAGGVGLNLAEANRVVCLDLSWNSATENQAFDRVHRMGQQKEVYIKRFIVRNTVEERMLNLQAKKQSLADAAMGEGKAQKIKKMTISELKSLFGM